jgi:protein-S-isoprenylcysteine O-methyltransferase Ste14
MYLLRHVLAVLVLPGTVAVAVPIWIARRYGVRASFPGSSGDAILAVLGVGLFALGAALFVAALHQFATAGRGTLAPWDPPRRLVVNGPYRFVRNPMIAGVIFIVFGIALALRSWPHGVWAMAFLLINAIYLPLDEEPRLERRFGADYREYREHVPRFVPRLRPWHKDS